jgi:hypothetical protein
MMCQAMSNFMMMNDVPVVYHVALFCMMDRAMRLGH